ncbi:MAG TPA: PadR family transcriptional regulator [Thermoanaerobaculia bacterium]|nr:PadR family transcriptional regulator [Thermoanaerobaculia bacterium]
MPNRSPQPARREPPVESFLPLGPPVFHILLALGGEVLHGYAIQRRFEEGSGGEQILPGTLYSSLAKMREWGLVEEVSERPPDDDPRRRYYRATALGREVTAAEAARMERLVAFARRQALTGPR